MGIKSWLFGKDRKEESEEKQTQAIAKLKKQLNSLEVRGKNLRRKSEEQKKMARKMLKDGNRTGAKQALKRSNIYIQKYNRLENMKLNLSTQIDTIEESKGIKETKEALDEGIGIVDETLEDVSPKDVERTMVEMEEQRDKLDMVNESMADTTAIEMSLEGEMDDSIDDQLAAMEMEIQSESHGDLPEVGTGDSEETSASPKKEKDEMTDLEDDLKSLQDELESE